MAKYSEDEEIVKAKTEFFDIIKAHILNNFEPVPGSTMIGVVTMSSIEIFNKMQMFFPSRLYKIDDVALWMQQAGFTFLDMTGNMDFEWILKPKNC